MNEQDKPLAIKPREFKIVEDSGPLANLLDTARFEHMIRIAGLMSSASLIPDHIWRTKEGNLPPEVVKANCFLIVNQALRWGIDPFAAAPETYVVGGKLGFQGKLVAAIINYRAPIESNLDYSFEGKGDALTITVSATIKGESKPRTVTLSVAQGKTSNQMWTKDPEQKLVYSGATKWARRHCPEVILGVLTDDDIDRIESEMKVVAHVPRAKAPKEDKALPSSESVAHDRKIELEGVPAEDAKPAETSASQTLEQKLQAILDADQITNEEFLEALTFFEIKVPKDFKGVESMRDKTIEQTIEGIQILKDRIMDRRTKKQEAP